MDSDSVSGGQHLIHQNGWMSFLYTHSWCTTAGWGRTFRENTKSSQTRRFSEPGQRPAIFIFKEHCGQVWGASTLFSVCKKQTTFSCILNLHLVVPLIFSFRVQVSSSRFLGNVCRCMSVCSHKCVCMWRPQGIPGCCCLVFLSTLLRQSPTGLELGD